MSDNWDDFTYKMLFILGGGAVVRRPAQPRRGALLASAAVGIGAIAGALSAEANFVSPGVAAVLGAGASAFALYGELVWQQRVERVQVQRAWRAAVMPGPAGGRASDTSSVLAALNPDLEVVPFSPLRGADVRALLAWCSTGGLRGVWRVAGEAGSGKTRLLLEVTHQLERKGWSCGWVQRGRAADAISVAAMQPGQVLLVVDDADTSPNHADLAGMLTALVRQDDAERVRVVLVARDFGGWWGQLREGLDPAVHTAITPSGNTRLAALAVGSSDQQHLFNNAVQRYARHFDLTPPAATLTGLGTTVSLAELHAAAASVAHHGLTGAISIDTALQQLFTTEETWWQTNATAWGLSYPLPVLQTALTAATLIGAADRNQMARRLHCLPGLTAIPPERLTDLALWLHQLYAQRGGEWLDPHLPARISERYAAQYAASQPALPAALAAAALTD